MHTPATTPASAPENILFREFKAVSQNSRVLTSVKKTSAVSVGEGNSMDLPILVAVRCHTATQNANERKASRKLSIFLFIFIVEIVTGECSADRLGVGVKENFEEAREFFLHGVV